MARLHYQPRVMSSLCNDIRGGRPFVSYCARSFRCLRRVIR